MNFITNPIVLAVIAGTLVACITYVYLKKSLPKDTDDDVQTIDTMSCVKVAGLASLSVLCATGYLNYAHSLTEEASLTAEFFQTGQPQF